MDRSSSAVKPDSPYPTESPQFPAPKRVFGFMLAFALCLAFLSAETMPYPSFRDEGMGWDLQYSSIASEDFSTPVRVTRPGCSIAEGGAFETKTPLAGEASLRGSSTGTQGYLHYFHTLPESLALKGGAGYRLSLSYRIVEAGDKGFEVLLYSPTGVTAVGGSPGSSWRDRRARAA